MAEPAARLGDLHLAEITDDLIIQAVDLAEDEGLRGYDAVHLASALYLEASILTSADTALCEAAVRNGLHIANPLPEWVMTPGVEEPLSRWSVSRCGVSTTANPHP